MPVLVNVVKSLREAIKMPANSVAHRELQAWDETLQRCDSSECVLDDVNCLINSVKAFGKASKAEEKAKDEEEDVENAEPFLSEVLYKIDPFWHSLSIHMEAVKSVCQQIF